MLNNEAAVFATQTGQNIVMEVAASVNMINFYPLVAGITQLS